MLCADILMTLTRDWRNVLKTFSTWSLGTYKTVGWPCWLGDYLETYKTSSVDISKIFHWLGTCKTVWWPFWLGDYLETYKTLSVDILRTHLTSSLTGDWQNVLKMFLTRSMARDLQNVLKALLTWSLSRDLQNVICRHFKDIFDLVID